MPSYMHRKTLSVVTPSGTLNGGQLTYTAEKITEISMSVPDSTTDLQVDIAIDFSQVVSCYILSTQDLTIETNSGGAPADTLVLKAGKAYEWDSDSYHAFVFGTDVTAFFLTNASGNVATLTVSVLEDPTDT